MTSNEKLMNLRSVSKKWRAEFEKWSKTNRSLHRASPAALPPPLLLCQSRNQVRKGKKLNRKMRAPGSHRAGRGGAALGVARRRAVRAAAPRHAPFPPHPDIQFDLARPAAGQQAPSRNPLNEIYSFSIFIPSAGRTGAGPRRGQRVAGKAVGRPFASTHL